MIPHKYINTAVMLSVGLWLTVAPGSISAGNVVTRDEGPTGTLSGKTIALWNSHGRYFDQESDRWQWQRPRLFGTVEDLYTTSYVIPFLIPMLENAGAYVMTPRERDTSPVEIIIDGDGGTSVHNGYHERTGRHKWAEAPAEGFAMPSPVLKGNENPFRQGHARMTHTVQHANEASSAQWNASIPETGQYAVYVSYVTLPESVTDARYKVSAADGEHFFTVNQRQGGGTWIYLGSFPFEKTQDSHRIVELTNISSTNGVITADAVKIGGGMGNVARKGKSGEYSISGYPRFTEGARYWLQWAGAPDSVYCASDWENDYTDDFKSRGLWVNWLMGGSPKLPEKEGLGINIDMSMGFHSDAGITEKDSIIGTLGIYCTERRGTFADGRKRILSRQLTDAIVTSVVSDISRKYRQDWSRRKMRDRAYAEARTPQVPAMLLELLSHQNPADMRLGLDPNFRFDVCRAVYKGILRYFAATGKTAYTVQPLPVRAFGINHQSGTDRYILSWKPTVDPLERTAMPSSYIIEERINDGTFRKLATVTQPSFTVNISDRLIHSYRITATNAGGNSFPSEILALCHNGESLNRPQITVVNGFTRTSAPQWIESGNIGGFDYQSDMGVPYIYDVAYTGPQYDFMRDSQFLTNDSPGYGASRANYETQVLAGNTFDNAYAHGCAIAAAGYPFISTSAEAFMADSLSTAPVVDLILGKQREVHYPDSTIRFSTFTPAMQSRLQRLTQNGSSILISGSYVASGSWDSLPYRNFTASVLGYKLNTPKASTCGEVTEVRSPYQPFNKHKYRFYTEPDKKHYPVESPDAIAPSDDRGAVIMRYTDTGTPAAVAFNADEYRTLIMGFPFESVKTSHSKETLMKQCLDFLTAKSRL